MTKDKKVFYCGWKLYYWPWLFDIDYEKFKTKSFAATDKGVALVTEDNKFFFNGNFWRGKLKSENSETGVKELDAERFFDGKEIEHVGG